MLISKGVRPRCLPQELALGGRPRADIPFLQLGGIPGQTVDMPVFVTCSPGAQHVPQNEIALLPSGKSAGARDEARLLSGQAARRSALTSRVMPGRQRPRVSRAGRGHAAAAPLALSGSPGSVTT